MHSPSAVSEHVSLNLAWFFLLYAVLRTTTRELQFKTCMNTSYVIGDRFGDASKTSIELQPWITGQCAKRRPKLLLQYRAEKIYLYVVVRMMQASWGRSDKQQQEHTSTKYVQRIFLSSVETFTVYLKSLLHVRWIAYGAPSPYQIS